jgi:hypothetical protein
MSEKIDDSKETPTLGRALYALLLAFLSVGGIASAWMYQFGRAEYFKIPKGLIRTEISEIGLALLYLAPCLVPIFFAPVISSARRKSVLWIALPCLALAAFALDAMVKREFGVAGGAAWWVLTALASAFIERPWLQRTHGESALPWLAGLTFFAMFASEGIGSFNAQHQRDFYVIAEDSSEYVVLAIYGDRLVLAPLAPNSDAIEAKVEVRTLGKEPVLAQRWRLPDLTVQDFVQVDWKVRAELRAQRASHAALSP